MSVSRSCAVVTAGFIPLIDCATLVVARELGFAREEGVDLRLARETSWANIRDRVAVGHHDVAHMLGPMPIASALGLTPLAADIIAPMAIGQGGNVIIVSSMLGRAIADAGGVLGGATGADAVGCASAAGAVLRQRGGARRPVFGVVHPHSGHYYELSGWLACAGLREGRDFDLVVLPPSLMVDALAGGQIDGFCVGEPWGAVARLRGAGALVTTNAALRPGSPNKVLGLRANALATDTLHAVLRALYRAALWCDARDNRAALARLLSAPQILDQPEGVLLEALGGEGASSVIFAAAEASFPWRSHASWFYAQMARFGQIVDSAPARVAARATWRPDLWRAALGGVSGEAPAEDDRIESASATDVFAPEGRFDPFDIGAYLAAAQRGA